MVIKGNKLRHGANEALCLQDFVQVWEKYVEDLGLGYCKETKLKDIREKGEEWENLGKTEDRLELVYRWAGGKKKRKRGEARKRRKKVLIENRQINKKIRWMENFKEGKRR